MMADKPLQLVPKLRFPEFQRVGDWKHDQIDNVASITKGKGVSKADITEGGATPCIRYAELYTHYGEIIQEVVSRTNVPHEELTLSQAEDIIVPASGETRADIARAACILPECVALGSDLNILRSDLYGPFFSYLLNSPLRHTIAKMAQGDTVAHLYPKQLSQVWLAYPIRPEQRKVADCLGSLDDLIEAEGRKLEALRQHKQGLMQRLFPQPGETVPRLRFPEFQNSQGWSLKPLGKVLKPIVREREKPIVPYIGLGIKSHGRGTFRKELQQPEKTSMKRLYEVDCDDLILNITFAWEGAIAIVQPEDVGALVSHRFPTYQFDQNAVLPEFFRYPILDKQFIYNLGVISPGGAGRNRVLNKLDFLKIELALPEIAEQRKIADCLGSLDDLMAAAVRKLEALRQHKQGLMQQMFPTLER